MNALAFVCVAIRIGQSASPRAQLEILGQALKETRKGVEEASVLGVDVQGFETAIRGYVSACLGLHIQHISTGGLPRCITSIMWLPSYNSRIPMAGWKTVTSLSISKPIPPSICLSQPISELYSLTRSTVC